MVDQASPRMRQQKFGLRATLDLDGGGDRIAFVIVEIALLAQRVEDDHRVRRQTQSLGQSLLRRNRGGHKDDFLLVSHRQVNYSVTTQ